MKKKLKREYLGRIIDNVAFFQELSCVHFIFINSHVRILFFINSRLTILIGNNTNVIMFISDLQQVGGFFRELRFPPPIKLTVMKQEVYGFISKVIQAIDQPLH